MSGFPGKDADFFELLRRLETPANRFGRDGGPREDPAVLGQALRLAFAASDVEGVTPPKGDEKARILVNLFGLYGPEGPMPLHMTRWMMTRASDRWFSGGDTATASDTAFHDLSNMLQHRMIAYFWRSWADTRPEVQIAFDTGGPVGAMLRALGASGLPGLAREGGHRLSAKLRHATSLAQTVAGPERIAGYLETLTGVPVRIREFVAERIAIPKHLQTRVGMDNAMLGVSSVAGTSIFERANRAEIVLGPLSSAQYSAFVSERARLREIAHAIDTAMGQGLVFDLRLEIDAAAVPEPRLGRQTLGVSAWLGAPAAARRSEWVLRDIAKSAVHEAAA